MVEPVPEMIEWAVLADNYIAVDLPIEQPILASPDLRLVYATNPGRLGLRLRVQPGRTPSRASALRNITIRSVLLSGQNYIEVLTDARELFRAIYALITDVTVRIKDGQTDALSALESSLSAFQELVAQSQQMSREKAVGLFGEMAIFAQLLESGAAASCWIGAGRECHDFRLGRHELEIKTTVANVREHVIHGLNQLSPSPDHLLSLISIRIGSPGSGDGRSLNDIVDAIRLRLSALSGLAQFNSALTEVGYDPSYSECSVRYQLNAPVMDVAIRKDFPAISQDFLGSALGVEAAARVRNVSLTLNVEGLGIPFDPACYVGTKA